MKYVIILLLYFPLVGFSQTFNYTVSANNASIGNLTVTKVQSENSTEIEVVCDIKIKLFISIDLKYRLNSTYKNNELVFSSVTVYVNGKIHSTSTAEKNGEYYTLTKDGHSSRYLHKITYSGALLYFIEPKGLTNIFSEFSNSNKSIKSIKNNEYQIVNPKNGHLSIYKYKNGILENTIIHHTLLTFSLTKK